MTDTATRRGMLVVGAFVLTLSAAGFFRVPLLPAIGAELTMSATSLGLVTTAYAFGRLLTDLPAGRLADRVATLRSLGLAGAVLCIGSVGFATATDRTWIIGTAFVVGVASALANTAGMTYFSTAVPTSRRGMSMAYFSAALLGGQSLGPLVGGVLADLVGWRGAIAVAAGLGAAIVLLAIPGQRRGAVSAPRPEVDQAASASDDPPGERRSAAVQRWMLYAVGFTSFFMLGSMPQTLVPIIGGDRFGLTASAIGVALGVGGVCRFVGALAGGRVADRVSRKAALVPGMALGAVGVAILALDLGVVGWVVAIALLSLGSYGISTGATMLADLARGERVGRRLGRYRFIGDLGLITGPALSGLLYEWVSDRAAVLLVAGLMATVALLCGLVLEETRTTRRPDSRTATEGTS